MMKPNLIYIVSRGHSGSTILELLLNRSVRIAAMGEIDLLPLQLFRDENTRWIGRCSCGARPIDCPVWRPVLDELVDEYGERVHKPLGFSMSDIGIEEETKALLPTLTYRMRRAVRWGLAHTTIPQHVGPWRTWVERRERVMAAYARVQQVDWLVDASKDPLQMLDLVRYASAPVKVIFLTRDVRGLACSAIRECGGNAARESRQWSTLNRRILHLLQRLDPKIWMLLHYEELCADPQGALNRIHDFVGIPPAFIDSTAEFKKRHTIAGNRVRFSPLEEIREDRAWETNLGDGELAIIRQHASKVAHKLGYTI